MEELINIFIFFKILFWGEVILLTPEPIDVIHKYELHLNKQIKALTNGAHFNIEILDKEKDYSYPNIYKLIPPKSVKIYLYDTNNNKILFQFEKGIYNTKNEKGIQLYSKQLNESYNSKYNKIIIYSSIPIKNIKIYWSNFKK